MFCSSLKSQQCNCRAPEPGAITRKGYFEELTLERKRPYKKLRGVVYLAERPAEDVLIELFPDARNVSRKRSRLRACITGPDGRFCFSGVPKGKYEVRASKEGGFEITHYYVVIDPRSRKSATQEMSVPLELGK